jgi:hypothetical protein
MNKAEIEEQIKDYIDRKRRKVVNRNTGRFGFVEESRSSENVIDIFYPYPQPEVVTENDEDIDFCCLDGVEFKYN